VSGHRALRRAAAGRTFPATLDRQETPSAAARAADLRSAGLSLAAAAAILDEEGYRRPRGGPWHARQVARLLESHTSATYALAH
jgi:hypothetical protein